MAEIEMPEYPNKSMTKKEDEPTPQPQPEKKLVKKIVSGRRVVKKESVFLDTLRNVSRYILFEILIPAAKTTISEMMSNGTDMILWGETRRSRHDRDRTGSRVSYTNYFPSTRERDRERYRERDRSRYRMDEIVLDTRQDADEVLTRLLAILDEYESVTVSEYYEIMGVPSEFTDQNYGWTNLRDAVVQRIREGYIIDLPEPKLLPR